MGNIWTRLLGKESTRQTLERIQNQLDQIDEYKRSTQSSERKVVGHLFFAFIVIYLAAALLTYLCFFYHPDWQGLWLQTQLLAPFLIAPVIFYYAWSGVIWYYHQKICWFNKETGRLKQENKDILKRVMETETYKVAKELLDKFGNDHTFEQTTHMPSKKVIPPETSGAATPSERSYAVSPSARSGAATPSTGSPIMSSNDMRALDTPLSLFASASSALFSREGGLQGIRESGDGSVGGVRTALHLSVATDQKGVQHLDIRADQLVMSLNPEGHLLAQRRFAGIDSTPKLSSSENSVCSIRKRSAQLRCDVDVRHPPDLRK